MADKVRAIDEGLINSKLAEINEMLFRDTGLRLQFVDLSQTREQTLNARYMTRDMFNQLKQNIGRAKALESIPLLADVDGTLEVVSGHHRIRAAMDAGVRYSLALVYSGLGRNEILAKQLAHNSISGQDNPEILRKIYEQITDVEAQLEAFIDPKVFDLIPEPVQFSPPDIDLLGEVKVITFALLPVEKHDFDEAMFALIPESDEIYLAHRETFDTFREALQRVRTECKIRSAPTAVAELCRLALKALDAEAQDELGAGCGQG